MDAKQLVERFEENKVLKEKRKEKFLQKYLPFYGSKYWDKNDEIISNQEFWESEKHARDLESLLEFFMNKFQYSDNVTETMRKIRDKIENDGGIDYDRPFGSLDGKGDFTEEEEECVINYAYNVYLKQEREERNKLERHLEVLMPVGTVPSVVAEHCI
jgi:hypothetical protein